MKSNYLLAMMIHGVFCVSSRERLLRERFLGQTSVLDGLWMENGTQAVLAQKMIDAKRHQRPFIVAFGGTSITAGHDNYFNETYHQVFKRTFAPVLWGLLGVRLEVRSAAHGANPHLPFAMCAEQFYGAGADVVSIEMKVMTKARVTARNVARSATGGASKIAEAEAAALSRAAAVSSAASPAAMTEAALRSVWNMAEAAAGAGGGGKGGKGGGKGNKGNGDPDPEKDREKDKRKQFAKAVKTSLHEGRLRVNFLAENPCDDRNNARLERRATDGNTGCGACCRWT